MRRFTIFERTVTHVPVTYGLAHGQTIFRRNPSWISRESGIEWQKNPPDGVLEDIRQAFRAMLLFPVQAFNVEVRSHPCGQSHDKHGVLKTSHSCFGNISIFSQNPDQLCLHSLDCSAVNQIRKPRTNRCLMPFRKYSLKSGIAPCYATPKTLDPASRAHLTRP